MIVDKLQQLGQHSIAKIQGMGRATLMLFGALSRLANTAQELPFIAEAVVRGGCAVFTDYSGVGVVYRHGAGVTRLHCTV